MLSISEEIIATQDHQKMPSKGLRLKNGASARILKSSQSETLQITSPTGGVLFEYDAESGRSRVMVPSGDLEFVVPQGAIHFSAKKGIHMKSPEFNLAAGKGRFYLGECDFLAKRFLGRIARSKLILGRLESVAGDVIQRVRNVFSTVAGLSQLRAGRMRTLVESTVHLKAAKVYQKAEGDFKINGEKIHLG